MYPPLIFHITVPRTFHSACLHDRPLRVGISAVSVRRDLPSCAAAPCAQGPVSAGARPGQADGVGNIELGPS